MKDLGLLRYFLGIEVASSPKGYLLSKSKYVNEIINRAQLTDDKVVDTSIELHAKFSSINGIPLNDLNVYQKLVGWLVYLIMTCLDITYAVYVVSQFVFALRSTLWVALLRIFRYVRGTIF